MTDHTELRSLYEVTGDIKDINTILVPRDRLEKAEKDAERWRYSVEIGGNQTMNWLDVYDDWNGDGDFTAQIDSAMEASK